MRAPVSRRGFALVFSLFLVMVLYTGMTIMMATHKTELRTSTLAFEAVQSRFASQAAVNKLLVMLKNGSDPADFTEDEPLEIDIGHFQKVKAWVQQDENSGVFHLRSQFQGETYSKVITQSTDVGARTYLNEGGVLHSAGPNDTGWMPIPEPPKKVYNADNELIDCTKLVCGYSPAANSKGQVVATYSGEMEGGHAVYLWDEGTRSWSDVTPPGRTPAPVLGGPQLLYKLHSVALGEDKLYNWDHNSDLVSHFSHYDLRTETWSPEIPGPFNGASIRNGFLGPDDSFVAEVAHQGRVRAMQWTNDTWSELPPLPGGVQLDKLNANGHEDEIYATGSNGVLYKFEQGAWTDVPTPVPAEKLLTVDASGAFIFSDESAFFRWDHSSEPKELPDTNLDSMWGITGGGSPEASSGDYQTTATF